MHSSTQGALSIAGSADTSKVITSQSPEEARMWKTVKQNLSQWVCLLLDTGGKVAVADGL